LKGKRHGRRVTGLACDLTDEAAVEAFADRVHAGGQLDVATLRAGLGVNVAALGWHTGPR